jgi:hypothetical protein
MATGEVAHRRRSKHQRRRLEPCRVPTVLLWIRLLSHLYG